MNTTHCTAQNGTYCCQLPEGHTGDHQSIFRSVGVSKLARWADAYAPIRVTRKS